MVWLSWFCGCGGGMVVIWGCDGGGDESLYEECFI